MDSHCCDKLKYIIAPARQVQVIVLYFQYKGSVRKKGGGMRVKGGEEKGGQTVNCVSVLKDHCTCKEN